MNKCRSKAKFAIDMVDGEVIADSIDIIKQFKHDIRFVDII